MRRRTARSRCTSAGAQCDSMKAVGAGSSGSRGSACCVGCVCLKGCVQRSRSEAWRRTCRGRRPVRCCTTAWAVAWQVRRSARWVGASRCRRTSRCAARHGRSAVGGRQVGCVGRRHNRTIGSHWQPLGAIGSHWALAGGTARLLSEAARAEVAQDAAQLDACRGAAMSTHPTAAPGSAGRRADPPWRTTATWRSTMTPPTTCPQRWSSCGRCPVLLR